MLCTWDACFFLILAIANLITPPCTCKISIGHPLHGGQGAVLYVLASELPRPRNFGNVVAHSTLCTPYI